jgi:2-phospho-L-lactate guanylyltransferase (CobY/MobA/RfbA family)
MPTVTISAKPTLVIFTLGPDAEARRHPLLPEGLRAEEMRLRRTCLENVLRLGKLAGCRVELSSPAPLELTGYDAWSPQCGADFGERFANALKSGFDHGGPAIVVGADLPGLSVRHLEQALGRLGEDPDRVVVGPSPDGGFYLLAAARPLDAALEAVRWCSGTTRQTLVDGLRKAGRTVVFLDPLADLDTPADLERWIAAGPAPVADLVDRRSDLQRLLAIRRRPARLPQEIAPRSPVLASCRGRAPPLAAAP